MIQDAPAKTGAFFLGVLTDWTAVDKTGDEAGCHPFEIVAKNGREAGKNW
jgi:hypothetical protein